MPIIPDSEMAKDVKSATNPDAQSAKDVHANAHRANLGPVIPESIEKPASKEELKKRAEELNKKEK
ncbi:hypothetical protein P152DRAFT_458309 [Eremomyces bilateralis CBS 781.70]|uniref:Uncharacterized protein n=1 Tax=Eremomyces bilateralis CBS 781.70 TaxID=1392243 RepID=A0A6G1G3H8_9PEZI|nr:uncharacterized protein P152DRAFT_458309 [Eremomyces bilateralis CBS 781.70]KAF1812470.1 hypothetical protein P152DRAFT_458309 [Eremomyces bilateralis CBS 781.70]